jgi:hypothetical protein
MVAKFREIVRNKLKMSRNTKLILGGKFREILYPPYPQPMREHQPTTKPSKDPPIGLHKSFVYAVHVRQVSGRYAHNDAPYRNLYSGRNVQKPLNRFPNLNQLANLNQFANRIGSTAF